MTPVLHMTRTQEKRFYRNAVQACLEIFYGSSKPEAARLVRDWWARLKDTKAFASGIFLHAEPVNTAANILGVRAIALTERNRTQYHGILNESRDLALSKAGPAPSSAQLKRAETGKHNHLVHLASSNASAFGTRTALQARAKKATKNKATPKRQVAFS